MRAREHVGELRPSQLLHTYGVGATVELPEMTTLVLGLDDWPDTLSEAVSEPRLLAAVRAVRGEQVARLLTPPVVPDGDGAGVPVSPFPRWLRCPLCSLLAPIENDLFTFKPDPWRPERTTYVHEGCPKSHSRRPPTAFPARYLMACQDGHLDDFPWVEFLHGPNACRGTLRLAELGTGGRPGDVQLSCDGCGRRRRLSQAFGEDARPFLPARCRGRHPHIGTTKRDCRQEPLTLVLGSSNSWFPVQLSALSIPSREGELAQAVEEAWADIEELPRGRWSTRWGACPGSRRCALWPRRWASRRCTRRSRRGGPASTTVIRGTCEPRSGGCSALPPTRPSPMTSNCARSARRARTRASWPTWCSSSACAR